jgi:hypothetical protein
MFIGGLKVKRTHMFAVLGILALMILGSVMVAADVDARRWRRDDDEKEEESWGNWRWRWTDARIRAVHLSPDAPAVDVWVDGNKVISSLKFGEVTDYLRVPFSRGRDTYNIQVVPAGQTSPVVIDADLKARPLRDYTIVAADKLENIQPIVMEDFRYSRSWFRSSVRFVHTAPDAPAVDVAVKDGQVLFSNVQFTDVEDYLRVRKGSYDLEVRLAGTNTVVLSVDDVMLKRGRMYTVFATGLVSPGEDEPSLGALLVLDR